MKPENRVHGLGLKTDLSWVTLPEQEESALSIEGNAKKSTPFQFQTESWTDTTLDTWNQKGVERFIRVTGDASLHLKGNDANTHLIIRLEKNCHLHITHELEGICAASITLIAEDEVQGLVTTEGSTDQECFMYSRRDSYLHTDSDVKWVQADTTTRGLVRINKPAFSSDGYQKSDVILLDNDSHAISIPDLEIHNHDVACSHGSTISKLDEDKLHYMMTRGIPKSEASKTLIKGFFSPHIPEEVYNRFSEHLIKPLQKAV